ncbi:MAG: response regulator transcription factor [Thermoflavifilum aggregans]|mgnify:CR=1 FL=1|nr:response regulator transcription factor [Thermoflavifilum aggregans]
MKILIVEDEKALQQSIMQYLNTAGFQCESADNFRQALHLLDETDYDAIVLDIMLPDGDGLSLLKILKEDKKQEGVIVVSARGDVDDRILGLKLGADDYLSKPFHMAELAARLHAIIRRKQFQGMNELKAGEICVNLEGREVYVNGLPVNLTRKEYDLLLFFLANKNRVISRQALAEHLCQDHQEWFDDFDLVYAHVKNLKKKLADRGCTDCIKSVYGIGYRFIC